MTQADGEGVGTLQVGGLFVGQCNINASALGQRVVIAQREDLVLQVFTCRLQSHLLNSGKVGSFNNKLRRYDL